METKDIQKLLDYISKSDLDEVNIETSELKLSIKRSLAGHVVQAVQAVQPIAAPAPVALPSEVAPKTQVAAPPAPAAAEVQSNLIEVKSPMIGTFYRSAGPDKPSFVEVGDTITEGSVICIIEAMKLFNEIESEISGKVVKVLVEDASPVEFDQPLFLVEPI
jgi:acetyl-CoA carboxylase biotin carboxyl carrier protein